MRFEIKRGEPELKSAPAILNMDAKELTKVVNDLSNRLITVENYLNTLKIQVADINIDVKMLEARR